MVAEPMPSSLWQPILHSRVICIGAGLSGLALAIRLQQTMKFSDIHLYDRYVKLCNEALFAQPGTFNYTARMVLEEYGKFRSTQVSLIGFIFKVASSFMYDFKVLHAIFLRISIRFHSALPPPDGPSLDQMDGNLSNICETQQRNIIYGH